MQKSPRHRFAVSSLRGTSLVEVMVSISVGTVLLSLGVGMIHLLLKAERDTSRGIRQATTLSRLSARWRDDVRAAQAAEILEPNDSGPARLILTHSNQTTISYSAEGSAVRRVVDDNGTPRHRDVFRFSAGADVHVHWINKPSLVRLEIIQQSAAGSSTAKRSEATAPAVPPARIVHLDAHVGGNRNLEIGNP